MPFVLLWSNHVCTLYRLLSKNCVFPLNFQYFVSLNSTEVGIYLRKHAFDQESDQEIQKKERKQDLGQESDQVFSFFFFSYLSGMCCSGLGKTKFFGKNTQHYLFSPKYVWKGDTKHMKLVIFPLYKTNIIRNSLSPPTPYHPHPPIPRSP